MAWRRPVTPPRIEPPLWYSVFDPASWDEMDAQEQAMFDGCPCWRPWPDSLHAQHAERRWNEAKYDYRREHPALATQEFEELVSGERAARRRERDE